MKEVRKFTPEELERMADALLEAKGFDPNGQPLQKKKRNVLLFPYDKSLLKKEIPAIG